MKLSVLDLISVRTGQSTSDALAATLALARRADDLGVHRYWVAEHHNMPAVASTNPPVIIAMIAGATRNLRVGSGGVMLPNHPPLVIAEQFALLEAMAPGRIDLGIGRAPGSDPVVTAVLGASGRAGQVDTFPRDVRLVAEAMSAAGAPVQLADGREYTLRATPAATGVPQIWLLGSSDYSARLAGTLGLPYVFASHFFAGAGTADALSIYRDTFEPSEAYPEPTVLVTVNAVTADSAEEAQQLALPALRQMARIRTGGPMRPVETVEEAAAAPTTPAEARMIEEMGRAWVIDEPSAAASRIRDLAGTFGADEVMISQVAGGREADDPQRYPARERSLELLVKALA
ncbi:MsnO8 family LLM class oxidoreductase [Spongisporangium articulatum]|uniref:MsnO8 family LLM class oxidoreductase n=1 Tax=Spongisporangium articulatum TaxID=3362603 RepID=A0ABW8AKA6_9ACTN